MATEITRQVGAGSDDTMRRLTPSDWSLTGQRLCAGAGSQVEYYQSGCGMRFTNITILQKATIDEAYLTIYAGNSDNGTVVNTRISAEDVDDAATFADNEGAFDTRWANRTTARVDWDAIAAWTQNTAYNSPEIKTVIQEIVDRDGWASGQDIVIFWEDFEDRSTHGTDTRRQSYSYEGYSPYAPQLVITYLPPPTQQAVGSGSIAIAGALSLKIKLAIGAGSIAIAGALNRLTKLAMGAGSMTITGALGRNIAISIGAGSITMAGAVGQLIKVSLTGVLTATGSLATRWLVQAIPDWRKMRGKKLTTIDPARKLFKNW